MSEVNENLDEVFEEELDDATVITVPIDATLSNSGEAADAKAVGDALALKADKNAVVNVSVNGQAADNQGAILIDGTDIPVSDASGAQTIAEAVAAVDGRTGSDIPLTGQAGSQTIAQAFNESVNKTADNIQMSSSNTQTVAEAIGQLQDMADGVVLSVNGVQPDGLGNVAIEEVAFARNLTSDSAQATTGTFVNRMAGGTASIADGHAFIQQIRGVNVHTGVAQESLTWEVDEAAREPGADGIDVSINRNTFVGVVTTGGTYTFVYDGADWELDSETVTLTTYGITLTGTPISGDEIAVTYVKASRGLISVATPTSFNATGWNLFNYTTGYARVFKYDHGYKAGGTYTMLQFSATISGTKTTITPVDGDFDIPSDGYVWVTGGNLTSTYITPTHTDWTEGPDVPFTTYSLDTIDLTTLGDLFEDGMCAVGGVYDLIDFELGRAIKKIEKLEYSDATIAALIADGRDYDADEDYIYAVMETADWETVDLSSAMDGVYTVSDHGLEWFDGTDVGPYCAILYGQNLKDKLVNDVLTISQQTLTAGQKAQVQENIGLKEIVEDDFDFTLGTTTWNGVYYGNADISAYTGLGYKCISAMISEMQNNRAAWCYMISTSGGIAVRACSPADAGTSGYTGKIRCIFMKTS